MLTSSSFIGVISFFAALAIFIYGMHIMSAGLQNSANSKFKNILAIITKNKYYGVLTGIFVTAVIQSSSSTTVMLVGFVNAGLMTLGQTVGVIMGANIGTTVTAWIVSLSSAFELLKPGNLAPFAIIIGVVMIFFSQKEKTKTIGQIVLGFGFLFFGLESMSDAVSPLRASPLFVEAFSKLGSNPVLGILAGAIVTAVIQSSSASVGILQVLALSGFVSWNSAVYIILGQNIGTCVTAILSSIGASKNAKATAYMHLLFNLIGSILFTIGALVFFNVKPDVGYILVDPIQVSIFHSFFNITNTVLLFPFANQIVTAASKLAKIEEDTVEKVVTLDERLLETPDIAILSIYNEIERMAGKVQRNFINSVQAITTGDEALSKDIIVQERAINEIDKNLTTYLIKLSHSPAMTDHYISRIGKLFHIINDIEQVGDYASEIAKLSKMMIDEEVEFSENGNLELTEFTKHNIACFKDAISSVVNSDEKLGFSVKDQESDIDRLEAKYRDLHLERLTSGDCSIATKVYFTDILSTIERVSDRASNMIKYL